MISERLIHTRATKALVSEERVVTQEWMNLRIFRNTVGYDGVNKGEKELRLIP